MNNENLRVHEKNSNADVIRRDNQKNNITKPNIKLSVVIAKIGSSLVDRQYISAINCEKTNSQK